MQLAKLARLAGVVAAIALSALAAAAAADPNTRDPGVAANIRVNTEKGGDIYTGPPYSAKPQNVFGAFF